MSKNDEKVAAAREALQAAGRRHAAADLRIMDAMKRYLSAKEYHEFVRETRKPDRKTPADAKKPADS